MKILITGAHGFVGQNLRAALEEIRAGHDRRTDHVLCGDPAEITVNLIGRENSPEGLTARRTRRSLCAGTGISPGDCWRP